jgi:hypothetical protein
LRSAAIESWAGVTGRMIALQLATPIIGMRLVAIANRTDGVQMPILETCLQIDSLVDQTLGCIRVHINHNRAVVN